MTLRWHATRSPLPDDTIDQAERALRVSLPPAYRAIIGRFSGGYPEPNEFTVVAGDRSWVSGVGVLLSLDRGDADNVFEYMNNLSVDAQLPSGVIPIADDGGGDLVCLDYRDSAQAPRVVYLSHDTSHDAPIELAASFDDFLVLLDRSA